MSEDRHPYQLSRDALYLLLEEAFEAGWIQSGVRYVHGWTDRDAKRHVEHAFQHLDKIPHPTNFWPAHTEKHISEGLPTHD